jgi:anthranilate synthase component 1
MEPITITQKGRWMPADIQTPISLFLGLVRGGPGILLESAEVDGRLGRYSLIAWDFKLTLTCRGGRTEVLAADHRLAGLNVLHGTDYVEGLKAAAETVTILPPPGFENLAPLTRGLYGYFGYGLAGLFEPRLAPLLKPEDARATMVLPAKVVLFDHLHHRCCLLSLDEDYEPSMDQRYVERAVESPTLGGIEVSPGEEEYKDAVSRAREMIRQGEAIQCVLSTRFSADFAGDPFVIYRRLRQVNPSPYMFYMKLPEVTLVGSSPELLVRCEGGHLETRPIAGTRPRGATEHDDQALAGELLADPKERAEHVMLVDLGRNDLGRIAAPGTVNVEKFMNVERFSHVMHLTSYVEARLKEGLDALDVLASAFPAGTLSGAPKVRAMEMIAQLEGVPRGPYGGAVGWVGLDKGRVDIDTGITIRTMWMENGKVNWQAGAGIVYDSDPDMEWAECGNKARVLAQVLQGKEASDVFTY